MHYLTTATLCVVQVRQARVELEAQLSLDLAGWEEKATAAFAAGDEARGTALLSEQAVSAGAAATAAWKALPQRLTPSHYTVP